MSGLATLAAVVLGGVLGWAGLRKLADLHATWQGFAGLRLPAPRLLAVAVPLAEIGTAALLAVNPRAGGATALTLLAAFSMWLVRAVRAHLPVACGCLGTGRSQRPVSAVELVRNGLLAAAALVALGGSRPAVPALPDVLAAGAAVTCGAVMLALAALRRDTGRLWDNHLPAGPWGEAT